LSAATVQITEPVRSADALGRVVEAARAARALAIDTEFMRERTYRARLCLVQVAVGGDVEVIDPLDLDLAPLAEIVADPDVEMVVHAGKQDLDIFYELYGVVPRNVFDVQVAAGFTGLGASLPYGRLVEAILGVALVKGESYTDWCRRPLTDAQLAYAADDVRYLVPVAQRLRIRLDELGRTAWARDEMRALEEPAAYGADPDEAWRKVGGRGSLSGRQLAALKAVSAWRERTAARRNVPRGWVMKDPTLVDIARRQPSSVVQLRAIRGVNAREVERSGRAILSAIDGARRAPVMEQTPAPPPREVLSRARMTAGLADAVVRARCDRARVATELVANRSELEAVLAAAFSGTIDAGRHRLLQGWRKELAGDALLALAAGDIAVRATSHPPYVEEVVSPWPTKSA
jgi:ribonuclease D